MKRFIPIAVCLLCTAWPLYGQLSSVGSISSPGQLRNVGSSSLDAFRGGAGGVGSLSVGGSGTSGLLNSSLSPSYSSTVRGAGDAGGMSLGLDSGRPMSRSFGPAGRTAAVTNISSYKQQPQQQDFLTRKFQHSQYSAPAQKDMILTGAGHDTQTITSLVPQQTGLYQTNMKDGETKFREGRYVEAFDMFQAAGYIGRDDAESQLSMSHAQFAIGSYATSGYYLCGAIEKLPGLPQLRLSPKAFYGAAQDYVNKLMKLEDYVQRNPRDGNGWLLLAYYSWFDDPNGAVKAKEALSRAVSAGSEPRLVRAAETFYEGMLATGKVSGKLSTAAPASQPAGGK